EAQLYGALLVASERLPESGVAVVTVELLTGLGDVPCGLHGPIVGGEPVPDEECRLEVRGERAGPSRVCDRAPIRTRQVTIIAGPHGGFEWCLYTAHGGPPAPREPWDPSLDDAGRAESERFWSQ